MTLQAMMSEVSAIYLYKRFLHWGAALCRGAVHRGRTSAGSLFKVEERNKWQSSGGRTLYAEQEVSPNRYVYRPDSSFHTECVGEGGGISDNAEPRVLPLPPRLESPVNNVISV